MAAAAYVDPVAQQDGLRSVRNFVSLLSGAINDQTYGETDAVAYNPANQFSTQGPQGIVVEGKPVVVATSSGARDSSMLWVIVAIGAAYLLLK